MNTEMPHRIALIEERFYPMGLSIMWTFHQNADDTETISFENIEGARAFIIERCEKLVKAIEDFQPRHAEYEQHLALAKGWLETAQTLEVGARYGKPKDEPIEQ